MTMSGDEKKEENMWFAECLGQGRERGGLFGGLWNNDTTTEMPLTVVGLLEYNRTH